jgi:hypothetical protein
VIDVAQLRATIAAEPYRRALAYAWGVDSAEGFLQHFVVGAGFAQVCKESDAPVSTDDRNHLEFGFARGVGKGRVGNWIHQMREMAKDRGWQQPQTRNGAIDWDKVGAQTFSLGALPRGPVLGESPAMALHRNFTNEYLAQLFQEAAERWKKTPFEPLNPIERLMLATCLVANGDPAAEKYVAQIRETRPMDADALEAQAKARNKQWSEAVTLLEKTFVTWRTDPWANENLVARSLDLVIEIMRGARDPQIAERFYVALKEPFAVRMRDSHRRNSLLISAQESGANADKFLAEVMAPMENDPVWTKHYLMMRLSSYRKSNHPRLEQAATDWQDFVDSETPMLRAGLKVPQAEEKTDLLAVAADLSPKPAETAAESRAPAPAPAPATEAAVAERAGAENARSAN